MATNVIHKFAPILQEAVMGKSDLRSNQKVYKKVYKHYKDMGIIMSGNTDCDYETVLNCLYEDLV